MISEEARHCFLSSARQITSYRVGARIIDISGVVSIITHKEQNITYVKRADGKADCYANCAKVLPFDQPAERN